MEHRLRNKPILPGVRKPVNACAESSAPGNNHDRHCAVSLCLPIGGPLSYSLPQAPKPSTNVSNTPLKHHHDVSYNVHAVSGKRGVGMAACFACADSAFSDSIGEKNPEGQIVFTLCPRQTRRRRASPLCACGAAGVVPATGLRTCIDG